MSADIEGVPRTTGIPGVSGVGGGTGGTGDANFLSVLTGTEGVMPYIPVPYPLVSVLPLPV